jgi:endonuclease/exonuclease/phosphatase family metal-dependent hydrolase
MVTAIPPLSELEKIEFGDNAATGDIGAGDAGFIVASYNIRYAVGQYLISGGLLRKVGFSGADKRAAKVAGNITTAAKVFSDGVQMPPPHIIALQEADKRTKRAGGHHVARELAEELGMTWIHAPAGIPRGVKPQVRQWWLDFEEPIDLYDAGDTGVAFLSHLPITDLKRLDLPWHECAWRPRLAIAGTVTVGAKQFRIINAHVDPHAAVGGQLEQLKVLVEEANRFSGPTLVLGDFNTLFGKKVEETRRFMESQGYTTPIPSGTPTWRGAGLRLHTDWIFSRDVVIKRWGVVRPLSVSDHWPIWAEVDTSDVRHASAAGRARPSRDQA